MAVWTEGAPDRVLAVFAHPDDPEMSCGGTLATWAAAGASVRLVVGNLGDKGSADPATDPVELAARRADEVAEACSVLGVIEHGNLGYPDGEMDNDAEVRSVLVGEIRAWRPDVVIAPDPTAVFFGDSYVNHRDHRVLGWAVLDACAPAASNPHYFPDAGAPHRVPWLLLSGTLEADTWIEIGDSLDAKIGALRCHRSQFDDGDGWIEAAVRGRAVEEGGRAGVGFAEGYRGLRLGA